MSENGQWCEMCQETKRDAYRRPDVGGVLCNGHYYEALRKLTPTDLVKIPRDLWKGEGDAIR